MKTIRGKMDSEEESAYYKNYRTNNIGNIKYVANSYEQVEKILRQHLKELLEENETSDGDSMNGLIKALEYTIKKKHHFQKQIQMKCNS
jgi:deoxyhypusine synthase